ncbi:MAG TPA: CRISPR-associated endonuclease Cas2 [Gammaproteobacteria bacterium]|nr:CRISPR-associated endonuclease Cas2 [Gammaproteobacteria bacterium]
MRNRKNWFIIAYDIRDPKRLRRVHYYLKKRALMAQRSVYLYKGDAGALGKIEKSLRKMTDSREDDIRLYPVRSPDALWEAGPRPGALQGALSGRRAAKPRLIDKLATLLQRNPPEARP